MNVLITGTGKGIGYHLSILFAELNHTVIAVSRNNSDLIKLKKTEKYANLHIIQSDLTKSKDMDEFIKEIKQTYDAIDILVNNAGYLVNKEFSETSIGEINESLSTNVIVPINIIQRLLPLLKKSDNPQIINIGSMGGFQGSSKYPGLSIYSASKAALGVLSECLAEEYKEYGIIVNCLALGATQTEMLEKAFPGYNAPVSAQEMAGFICNFALYSGKFINGKIIPVSLNNP